MDSNIPSTCSFVANLMRGSGVPASCKQIAPDVGLERSQMLRAETDFPPPSPSFMECLKEAFTASSS